nr:histidine kinase [Paenibacillus turpanensis]
MIILNRTFTRPLVRLGKLAHTVQRGNLEVRSHIKGNDEIGRLGASFDQMLDRIKQMIREITLEQSRKRKAELAMLQAQINPHFLFNVLNSIRVTVLRKGDQDSAAMLASLSRLLRMTIGREEESITLHEEVSIAIDYVALMNMRQKEKVQLHVDIAADVMLAKVPRFFLQPLIENAIIHGLQKVAGCISVSACQAESQLLEVKVCDDGVGMPEAALRKLRRKLAERDTVIDGGGEQGARFSGIGLRNVNERLRIRFGDAVQIGVTSAEGEGTCITVRIPLSEVNEHA